MTSDEAEIKHLQRRNEFLEKEIERFKLAANKLEQDRADRLQQICSLEEKNRTLEQSLSIIAAMMRKIEED